MQRTRWKHGGLAEGAAGASLMVLGVGAFGLVFGAAAGEAGLSWLQTAGMSALVFSGAAQTAILSLWPGAAGDFGQLAALGVVVSLLSLRFIIMGATLHPLWRNRRPVHLCVASFLIIDETWAVGLREAQNQRPQLKVFVGAGVLLYATWVASTMLGHKLGTISLDPRSLGLDFIVSGFLLVLLSGTARRADAVPCAIAATVAWLLTPVGQGSALLAAGAVGTAVSLFLRSRA